MLKIRFLGWNATNVDRERIGLFMVKWLSQIIRKINK